MAEHKILKDALIRVLTDMYEDNEYRIKPEPKTVKMWQWIVKDSNRVNPYLTDHFYEENPYAKHYGPVEWVRKAEWTCIEVEVDE